MCQFSVPELQRLKVRVRVAQLEVDGCRVNMSALGQHVFYTFIPYLSSL